MTKESDAIALKGEYVAARDTFADTFVKVTSERLREIVQGLCDADVPNSLEIAQSCGMDIMGVGGRSDQEWTVTRGETSGSVELTGSIKGYKNKRRAFQWQRTLDPTDQASWYKPENEILTTINAFTLVTGLNVKDTVYFRYRIILADGVTDWSETISIIIT